MILDKGMIVKHGTSFLRIDNIFKKGLIAGSKRTQIREKEEWAPAVNGIYIAQNISYYGALAAFTASMMEIAKSGRMQGGDIPIVLEIELGKDCEIVADEDYIGVSGDLRDDYNFNIEELKSHSQRVWDTYQTGVIINQNIPSSWIRNIEYPLLLDFEKIHKKKKLNDRITQDIIALVMAYGQTKHQATIEEFKDSIIKLEKHFNFKFQGYFTNKEKFNLTTLNKIKNTRLIKSQKKLFKYSIEFWKHVTEYLDYFGFQHK